MFRMLTQLADSEDVYLEPSALAGMYGPVLVEKAQAFREYRGIKNATHLVWATGGGNVEILFPHFLITNYLNCLIK